MPANRGTFTAHQWPIKEQPQITLWAKGKERGSLVLVANRLFTYCSKKMKKIWMLNRFFFCDPILWDCFSLSIVKVIVLKSVPIWRLTFCLWENGSICGCSTSHECGVLLCSWTITFLEQLPLWENRDFSHFCYFLFLPLSLWRSGLLSHAEVIQWSARWLRAVMCQLLWVFPWIVTLQYC